MLKPGWWRALTLHRDTAPLRSYVRKVQQVDDRGMRITMIDWLDGTASDCDFFVPWRVWKAPSSCIGYPSSLVDIGSTANRPDFELR